MNFLIHQVVASGGSLPPGPHFKHCYIHEGEHCSCGGGCQGSRPGPTLNSADVVSAAESRGVGR